MINKKGSSYVKTTRGGIFVLFHWMKVLMCSHGGSCKVGSKIDWLRGSISNPFPVKVRSGSHVPVNFELHPRARTYHVARHCKCTRTTIRWDVNRFLLITPSVSFSLENILDDYGAWESGSRELSNGVYVVRDPSNLKFVWILNMFFFFIWTNADLFRLKDGAKLRIRCPIQAAKHSLTRSAPPTRISIARTPGIFGHKRGTLSHEVTL